MRLAATEAQPTPTTDAAPAPASDEHQEDAQPESSEDEFADAPAAASDSDDDVSPASDSDADHTDDGDVMAQLDALMGTSDDGACCVMLLADHVVAGEAERSEEEGEAPEAYTELKGATNALRGKVATHKAQLEALKESVRLHAPRFCCGCMRLASVVAACAFLHGVSQDPEFYQYLQQSDPQLLAFGNSDDDDEEDDDEEDDDDDEVEEDDDEADEQPAGPLSKEPERQPRASAARVVQAGDVEAWCASATEGSLGAMRSLVKVFRVACHYGDSEESFEGTMRITSSATYNAAMMFMLKEVHACCACCTPCVVRMFDHMFDLRILSTPSVCTPCYRQTACSVHCWAWGQT